MNFLSDNFLLDSELSQRLYHEYAKSLPIIDYHSHVVPQMIADDAKLGTITSLWLGGDHYKWRLMRNCGIDEKYITGDADDRAKFRAFASIMPLLIGNPMYVWCHLELKRYFDCNEPLCSDNADEIYDLCNEKLAQDSFSVKNIIKRSGVELLCTTDDPIDDLSSHKKIADDKSFDVKVLPTFRPDKALGITNNGFTDYITALSSVSGININNIEALTSALIKRLDFFVDNGCFITDHGLTDYTFADCDEETADAIFKKALIGQVITAEEAEQYQTYLLCYLGVQYAKRKLTMQLHVSCLRNPNSASYKALGPDTGFDTINSSTKPIKLARLLDALNRKGMLPKTIVYSLDPSDNRLIESIINAFQGDGIKGKLQHGSAWWFNDAKFGITDHLEALAEDGVMGNFIGMLTDSRSFVSYTRHEYFRRILCRFIAKQVETGEYPNDEKSLKTLVQGISYHNAKKYFGI